MTTYTYVRKSKEELEEERNNIEQSDDTQLQIHKMHAEIEQGTYDTVLCTDIDRLGLVSMEELDIFNNVLIITTEEELKDFRNAVE